MTIFYGTTRAAEAALRALIDKQAPNRRDGLGVKSGSSRLGREGAATCERELDPRFLLQTSQQGLESFVTHRRVVIASIPAQGTETAVTLGVMW